MINNTINSTQALTEKYYCLIDHADTKDNDGFAIKHSMCEQVMAKKVAVSDKQNKFYARFGFDQKLYNPINPLNSGKNYKELNRYSENFTFRAVSELAFMYYIKYLSTKNNIWLVKAEREIV